MKRFLASLLAAALTMTAAVGCSSGSGSPGAASGGDNGNASAAAPAANGGDDAGDVIKIGVFEPQTGENGGGGLQEVYGIRYANQQFPTVTVGGKEYKVELVEADNKSDKTEAVTAAQS